MQAHPMGRDAGFVPIEARSCGTRSAVVLERALPGRKSFEGSLDALKILRLAMGGRVTQTCRREPAAREGQRSPDFFPRSSVLGGRCEAHSHERRRDAVDGGNAKQASVGWSYETLIDLLAQALHALAYLHDRGLLHLDVKADNLLVRAEGSSENRPELEQGVQVASRRAIGER